MVDRMASSKQETKKKNEAKVAETIVNYDIPVKPDDQLVLSHDVRIKIYIMNNNGKINIGTFIFSDQCPTTQNSNFV